MTHSTSDPFKWKEGVFMGDFRPIAFLALFRSFHAILSKFFPVFGIFIAENLIRFFMAIVSNLLGGMGLVFGLTFVVAVSDIMVSYVARDGKTLTELITEKVVA